MKVRILAITLLAPLALAVGAVAQTPAAPAGRPGQQRMGQMAPALKDLGLTREQAKKIREIVSKYRTDVKAIMDSAITPEEKAAKVKPLRADAGKAIFAVLTHEQVEKAKNAKLVDQLLGNGRERNANMMRLFSQLNLTDAQKTQIQPILKSSEEAAKAVREDKTLTPEAMRAKLMQLREESMTKIKALLTPEQLKKLEELMARRPGQGQNQPK